MLTQSKCYANIIIVQEVEPKSKEFRKGKGTEMEYKVIYRAGNFYQIIDKIFSEDSAYMVLTMVIKAGYEDARIEC